MGGWESGLWLSILSTLLDNNTFRAAIWLRIGASFCMPHSCQCGEVVNGLSCNRVEKRSALRTVFLDTLKTEYMILIGARRAFYIIGRLFKVG